MKSEFEEWFKKYRTERIKIECPMCTDLYLGAKSAHLDQQQIIDKKDAEIEKLKKQLIHVLDVSEVNIHEWIDNDSIECRGDEDCDHCNQLSVMHYARQALKELSEVESDKEQEN